MVKITDESSTKRRKKTTSASSDALKPEADVYAQVVAFEETEAASRSADKDAKLYCSTCENIRNALAEIETLKSDPENQGKIAEKRTEVVLMFVLLKKLNRYEKIRTKASRDALHKEKQRVDSTQLQLHNLLYELEHLKKEISKCLQFKSKDEEIELVPVEQFYKDAPEDISRPVVTEKDEHQLRLARLEWELRQRKELSESCHKLQAGKTKAAAEIVTKQERLDELAPRLNTILDVTKPLKGYFGINTDQVQEQTNLAYLLPDPLFLLYSQVDAYQKVYDKSVAVTIKGDEDDAKQLNNATISTVSDSESDQEQEERTSKKRHHRRISRSDRQEEKRKLLLTKHPLTVDITFKEDSGVKMIVTFYYLTKLQIVTTKCEVIGLTTGGVTAGDVLGQILMELFPNDVGEDSPNIANHYQLRQVGLGAFPTLIDDLGTPYNWAQRISGLEFLASGPSNRKELAQASVEVVLKSIQSRFQARLSLSKQIQSLENNVYTINTDLEDNPDNIQSKLDHFRRYNWLDVIKYEATKPFVENGIFESKDMIYRLSASRQMAKLHSFVCLKQNYPEVKPIFCVMIDWNGEWTALNSEAVRDMEQVINIEWPELSIKKLRVILSAQIQRLLASFDIYLETQSPIEFPQQKIYFKGIQGRNRCRPYKFISGGGGIFTQ